MLEENRLVSRSNVNAVITVLLHTGLYCIHAYQNTKQSQSLQINPDSERKKTYSDFINSSVE